VLLPGLTSLLIAAPAAAVNSLLAPAPAPPNTLAIYINVAMKQSQRPYLVLNVVSAPPAEASLDGISALIDGEIQFDSYADTPQAAQQLSNAVRDYLMKTFNAGALPDKTTIQFVDVTMDHDEPYEQGGAGYIYRRLLRLQALYTEAS
jgi:hypothetical protein